MPVSFRLKIKHAGASKVEQYSDKNGRVFSKRVAGVIEEQAINVTGRRLLETAVTNRERTLFLAAVFFQRVVNRTPVDENYYYTNAKGELVMHKKDDDAVRDYWVASYNNRKVTAKQLRESGISFDTFNDEGDIRKIYEAFRKAFIQGKGNKNIKSIHIDNTHERFPMLEYGEYQGDSGVIGEAEYKHGVEGGYSVQAPHGMLRITEAEFQTMSLKMSTNKLIKEYVRRSQRINKVPSDSKMKELKRIIYKGHINEDDLDAIERMFK